MNILDIGCGSNPRGTVNLDRFTEETPHHHHHIDAKAYRNFIKGDAQYPPIRRGVFHLIILSHVLEHLLKPAETLENLSEIAPNLIVVVPNNPVFRENETHLYSWSESSFEALLRYYYDDVTIYKTALFDRLSQSRILKIMRKTLITSFIAERIILRVFPLELVAYCKKSKKY